MSTRINDTRMCQIFAWQGHKTSVLRLSMYILCPWVYILCPWGLKRSVMVKEWSGKTFTLFGLREWAMIRFYLLGGTENFCLIDHWGINTFGLFLSEKGTDFGCTSGKGMYTLCSTAWITFSIIWIFFSVTSFDHKSEYLLGQRGRKQGTSQNYVENCLKEYTALNL